jgi:hypothetical protein
LCIECPCVSTPPPPPPAANSARWRYRAAAGHDRQIRRDPHHCRDRDIRVRASELANPRPGDQLTVGGETFVVQGEPERRDPERLVWMLDVRRE